MDLDPVVISAARDAMGFPADRWDAWCAWLEDRRRSLLQCASDDDVPLCSSCGAAPPTLKYACCCSGRLRAVQADAVAHVARLAAESPGGVDLAIIDVFDGMDVTPPAVSSPGADVCLTRSASYETLQASCSGQPGQEFPSADPVLASVRRQLVAVVPLATVHLGHASSMHDASRACPHDSVWRPCSVPQRPGGSAAPGPRHCGDQPARRRPWGGIRPGAAAGSRAERSGLRDGQSCWCCSGDDISGLQVCSQLSCTTLVTGAWQLLPCMTCTQ